MWWFNVHESDCCVFAGDRYDENPTAVSRNSSRNKMDEIEEWDSGKKTIADEVTDKVKGLWNKVQGRRGPDDIVDYR